MLSSSSPSPPLAMRLLSESQPTHKNSNRSLLKKPNPNHKQRTHNNNNNNNNTVEIEVEWKERHNSPRVRFHPDLDWKTETTKAEQGHLRRLAEKEIRKRLDLKKNKTTRKEWNNPRLQAELLLSRSDRQKEAFLYICLCKVDLLVGQYQKDPTESRVLSRMFDWLFEEAGIKPAWERRMDGKNVTSTTTTMTEEPKDSSASWLWTCFLALQLEYRRVYETHKDKIRKRSRMLTQHQPFCSGLGQKADQALFFVHWLSPAFRYEEKEWEQRQVYHEILGDSQAMSRLEDYLFSDESSNHIRELREEVHGFFESILHSSLVTTCSSSGSSSSNNNESSLSPRTDLKTFFLAMREADAGTMVWSIGCCKTGKRSMFPYQALTHDSKSRLFLIGAMPAYRKFLETSRILNEPKEEEHQQQNEPMLVVTPRAEKSPCCPELLQFGFSSSSSRSGNSNVVSPDGSSQTTSSTLLEEDEDRSETTALAVTDTATDVHPSQCSLLSPNYYEYEFSRELCGLLFESA